MFDAVTRLIGGASLALGLLALPGVSGAQTTTAACPPAEVDAAYYKGVCAGAIRSAHATEVGLQGLRAILTFDPNEPVPAVTGTTVEPSTKVTPQEVTGLTAKTVLSLGTGKKHNGTTTPPPPPPPPPPETLPVNNADLVGAVLTLTRVHVVLPQPTADEDILIADDAHNVFVVCKEDGSAVVFPAAAPVANTK